MCLPVAAFRQTSREVRLAVRGDARTERVPECDAARDDLPVEYIAAAFAIAVEEGPHDGQILPSALFYVLLVVI
jgi:hypothetical protein